MSQYRNQLEAYLKTLDISVEAVLDIGGSALPVKGRVKSWDVGRYVIMDNNLEQSYHKDWFHAEIKYDIQNRFSTNFLPEQSIGDLKQKFDVVFMLEVSEYLSRPWAALDNVDFLLKDGGIFYSTWITNYPVHEPKHADMMRYTRNWIVEAFEQQNFRILEIIPRKMTDGLSAYADFLRLEGMHPARRHDPVYDLGYIVKATKR